MDQVSKHTHISESVVGEFYKLLFCNFHTERDEIGPDILEL